MVTGFISAIRARTNPVYSSALLPTDTAEASEAVLTTFSVLLVSRINGIWEIPKQTIFLGAAAAALPLADPDLLRYSQRKFKSYQPRSPSEPTVFYDFHLGHVPRVYTTWKRCGS